jgi:hypothetical protein
MDTLTDSLVIHIGLQKTGTTTLQKKCFAHYDNAVMKYDITNKWKTDLIAEILHIFRKKDPSVWNSDEGKKYVQLIKAACRTTAGKPLIISNEGFSDAPIFNIKPPVFSGVQEGCFPVALHLRALSQACPWITHFRILLTLRNQPEWLASLYAQRAAFFLNTSQEDFEYQVRNLMSDSALNRGGFLNWGRLVQDLSQVVGKKNVTVLLLEEINCDSYWKTLSEITGLPLNPTDFVSLSRKRENVRRVDIKKWQMRRKDPELIPNPLSRSYFNFVKTPLRNILTGQSREFSMSDELSAEIRRYCKPFNQDLADWLGRDFSELSNLGY